jgi:predicted small lipoprotein YifL
VRASVSGPIRLVVVAALLFGLAACGDDGPATGPADGDGPEETTTTPPVETTTTAPATDDGEVSLWCAVYDDVEEYLVTREPAFTDEEIQALAADVAPVWSRLLANAPSGVRDDVAFVAEGWQRLAAGDMEPLEDERYDDAFDRIDDFVFDNCDF